LSIITREGTPTIREHLRPQSWPSTEHPHHSPTAAINHASGISPPGR
jgi:hypothetical protein